MTVGVGLRNLQAAIGQPECGIDMPRAERFKYAGGSIRCH
jgi:hypothetical protein